MPALSPGCQPGCLQHKLPAPEQALSTPEAAAQAPALQGEGGSHLEGGTISHAHQQQEGREES